MVLALDGGGWSLSNPRILNLWVPELVWVRWEGRKHLDFAGI